MIVTGASITYSKIIADQTDPVGFLMTFIAQYLFSGTYVGSISI
jgi:hypothetical protein